VTCSAMPVCLLAGPAWRLVPVQLEAIVGVYPSGVQAVGNKLFHGLSLDCSCLRPPVVPFRQIHCAHFQS
jgi:hypothetical protein